MLQEAFVVVIAGATVEGMKGQSTHASRTPQPGSESGADVRQVIRERERTHGLWEQRAAYGNGGVQHLSLAGEGGQHREVGQHETKRQLASTAGRRKTKQSGKGHE
jgi:hypothetical protein